MRYRKIGKWGIKVSEISIGSWLTYGGHVDEENSIEQIHFAYERGINFIDTANVYARGKSEEVVGKAISTMRRDSLVLATKVFFEMGDGPNDRGLSRKHVMEQCHASLRRMGTDYVDLYQCHRYDPGTPMEELVMTMDILTRQGKILYWGVSEWPADKIKEAVDLSLQMNAAPPIANQPCYNMFARNIEPAIIPVSEKCGLGQVVFSPLAQGALTGKYKPGQPHPEGSRAQREKEGYWLRGDLLSDETLEKVEALSKVAEELGISMPVLALAWCLRLQNVSSVIIGATSTKQIEENIKASGVTLSPAIQNKIEKILAGVALKH
ncbi:MAG: aldo/keto reductase family protein [Candidatus Obscuribacterales bacterium]|nr:aldo/keto reductase family protein [Candidatus Obscuribacterales bacterium]